MIPRDGPEYYERGWVKDGDVLLLMSVNGRVMGFKRA